jgi:type III secretory pathway component EscR
MLSLGIFFFSSKRKEKKTIEKKKNAEKRGSFPPSSYFALSLLAPTFAFSLLPFCFKCFFLLFFCFQVEEKKTKQRRKTQREEK